jgi:hypothetical protein
VNGTYAIWHTVDNTSDGAVVSEGYPSYGVFVNGWSKWKINWAAGSETLSADITDVAEAQSGSEAEVGPTQTFSGSFVRSEADCNAFAMHLDGVFDGTSGSSHLFVYDAELVYMGDHLNGTFAYTDTFTASAADGSALSGGLTGATGELKGILQIDSFDTGFSE